LANVSGSKEHSTYCVGNAGTLSPSIRHVITLLILQDETTSANYEHYTTINVLKYSVLTLRGTGATLD